MHVKSVYFVLAEMKQRSIKIAFIYACKINMKWGFMEACYNIKDL